MSVIVLVGSGEFTPAMKKVDEYLLSLLQVNAKVAILPTAAGQEIDFHKWIDRGVAHFRALGAQVYGVPIIEIDDENNKRYLLELEKADFIYVSGGNPGHLWTVIHGTPIEKLIRNRLNDKNFVLAGCSAGAMVMGEYIPSNIFAMRLGDKSAIWEKSLGLVPYTFLPHYDYVLREEKELFERALSNLPTKIKKTLIGIDEDTAAVVGSPWQIMGRGQLHLLNRNQTYQAGSILSL